MTVVAFCLFAVSVVLIGLFYTESFRERICAPLVRRIVARRRAAAMRMRDERGSM